MAPRGYTASTTRLRGLQNDEKNNDMNKEDEKNDEKNNDDNKEKETETPSVQPSEPPTTAPTKRPTASPTVAPTGRPTSAPTQRPTTPAPTRLPTAAPVVPPTISPTASPVVPPTSSPTAAPVVVPTRPPTTAPVIDPTPSPTVSPTMPPTGWPTAVPTAAPTSHPTEEPVEDSTHRPPTLVPTTNPLPTTATPTIAPTRVPSPDEESPTTPLPSFNEDTSSLFITSYELLFSIWSPQVPMDVQEPALIELLNVGICSTGAKLITSNWQYACPPSEDERFRRLASDPTNIFSLDDAYSSTVLWNQPITEAEWNVLELENDGQGVNGTNNTVFEYWKWNITYQVLQEGDETQEMLQSLLDDSIVSGRMENVLQSSYWPDSGPTKVSLVGAEAEMFVSTPESESLYGPQLISGRILRWTGVVLASWVIVMFPLLLILGRRHRKWQEEAANDPPEPPTVAYVPTQAVESVEKILDQSRPLAAKKGAVRDNASSKKSPSQEKAKQLKVPRATADFNQKPSFSSSGNAYPKPRSLLSGSPEKEEDEGVGADEAVWNLQGL